MCVMSMVMTSKTNEWLERYWPPPPPFTMPPFTIPAVPVDSAPLLPPPLPTAPLPTQEELDFLRRLMRDAKAYDTANNEPDCELGDKKALLRKMAKALGVELQFA